MSGAPPEQEPLNAAKDVGVAMQKSQEDSMA